MFDRLWLFKSTGRSTEVKGIMSTTEIGCPLTLKKVNRVRRIEPARIYRPRTSNEPKAQVQQFSPRSSWVVTYGRVLCCYHQDRPARSFQAEPQSCLDGKQSLALFSQGPVNPERRLYVAYNNELRGCKEDPLACGKYPRRGHSPST